MTNTQSPAPGADKLHEVEQTIAMVQAWHDGAEMTSDDPELDRIDFSKIIAVLGDFRTALQASAAAVEPVVWQYRMKRDQDDAWGPWSECAKSKYEQMAKDPVYLAWEPWRLEVRKLYTAPPLPAQVQAAEVTDALILEALAEQDVFLIHHQPGEDDRIPESGMFSDVTPADMRKAFAYIASRTPAPGMAGGVEPVGVVNSKAPSGRRFVGMTYEFKDLPDGTKLYTAPPAPARTADVVHATDTHAFKNFHRSLCARFDYTNDEKDWRRDLVSLEEHIATKIAQPATGATQDEDLLIKRVRQYRDLMREIQGIAVDSDQPMGNRLEMISARAYFAEKGEFHPAAPHPAPAQQAAGAELTRDSVIAEAKLYGAYAPALINPGSSIVFRPDQLLAYSKRVAVTAAGRDAS